MENRELITQIATEYGLAPAEESSSLNIQMLADAINELLNKDFQKLVSILYRMDISEAKLRLLLKDNPGSDAAMIIANMMVERQAQKIKSRSQFKKQDDNINDDEKWQ